MKCVRPSCCAVNNTSRSRKGAWIEINEWIANKIKALVAPARERGLKYRCKQEMFLSLKGRSRKGAWIEIDKTVNCYSVLQSLPQGSVD